MYSISQFHNIGRILFFALIFSIGACVSSESLENENNNMKRYAIGKGGGFTGDYTEYILNENGKVYKYDFNYDREVYYKTLEKADLVYFLEQIEKLSLDGIDINQPGNMSYYIDVRIGKQSMNKIVWGDRQYYPPKNLVEFHNELFAKLAEFE